MRAGLVALALSFTDYPLIDEPVWTGLDNYRRMAFDDPLFWKSLSVTLTFVAIVVPAASDIQTLDDLVAKLKEKGLL